MLKVSAPTDRIRIINTKKIVIIDFFYSLLCRAELGKDGGAAERSGGGAAGRVGNKKPKKPT